MGVRNGTRRAAMLSVGALWAVMLATAMLGRIQPAGAASLETYGSLPSLEDVALSPDGSKIAFVRTSNENTRVLAIVQISPHKVLGASKIGQTKLRELQWADNDHLLITTSTTGMPWGLSGKDIEWTQLAVFDVNTLKLKVYPDTDDDRGDLTILNAVAGPVMIRHIGNDTVLFLHGIYVQDKTALALFKVNLTTHSQRVVRQGSDATRGWLVNDAGEIVAEENYYERDQRWQMKIRRDGHWFDAESTRSPIDVPEMLGFGPKGDAVLVSTLDKDQPVWELLSLQDGKLGPQWVNDRDRAGDHIAGRYWDRYMGVQGPDDPALDAISPIKHIDKVNVPVMLVHGKDDTVVPYEQSEFMLKALTKANRKVELVTLKKEDHWLSRSETRLLMLQSSVAFLKANNPPD